MAKLKSVFDYVDVDKIKRDVQKTIDDKTDGLLSDFKNSSLDPDKLEGQIEKAEKALEPYEKAINKAETARKVLGYFKDPVGSAMRDGKQLLWDKINEVPQVQEIKSQIMEEVQSKLMEIPQVKQLKDEVDSKLNGTFSTDIPSGISSIADDPEQFARKIPGVNAIIEKVIRESGIGRQEIRG